MDALVELSFRISGATVPYDHGYALYSAVSGVARDLHDLDRLALVLFRGEKLADGVIRLGPNSRLRLRLPAGSVPRALLLAGKTLRIQGHGLHVGVPEVRPLVPSAALQARFVTIKKFVGEPAEFEAAVRRQLDLLGVRGTEVRVGVRRAVRITGVRIVGYGVTLFDLAPEDSLKVQESGIGGRRRMGCGVFEPLSEAVAKRVRAKLASAPP